MDEKENQIIENAEQTEEEAQKQAEETSDQADDEEILSEEQLEIQRDIEAYQSKIEQLDAKLAAHEAQHIDAIKREQMKKAHYSEVQIERYLSHIEGESETEIKESVSKLTLEIPPANDNFADPSPMNGAKQKPTPTDPGEVGKTLFERIKHRIWGGGATL